MSKAIVSSVLLVLCIASVANAQTTHTVGGRSNWNTGVNYDNWASGTTFITGDTLLFNYGPSHDVAEVNQADYDSCSMSNLISMDASSPTSITLSAPGTRYFVCSRSNHCSQGLKVTVTTVAASAPSPPPSSTTPSPPSGGTTPSPPSNGTTPTPRTPSTPATPSTPDGSSGSPGTGSVTRPPPPPPSGGAAGRSGMAFGLLSVAAVVGFMA